MIEAEGHAEGSKTSPQFGDLPFVIPRPSAAAIERNQSATPRIAGVASIAGARAHLSDAPEREERLVAVGPHVMPYAQAAKLTEPRKCALHVTGSGE